MMFVAAIIESYLRQSHMSDPNRYLFAFCSAVFWVLYLGFTRPPARWRREAESMRTRAEVWAPEPLEEELWHVRRAGRVPPRTG